MKYLITAILLVKVYFENRFVKLDPIDNWIEFSNDATKVYPKFKDKFVLGINSYFHDSSATIVKNGEVLWASQEERFTRKKNESAFPQKSISQGLDYLKLKPQDIYSVIYFENPHEKARRVSHQLFRLGFQERIKFVYSNAYRLLIHTRLFHIKFRYDLLRSRIYQPCFTYGRILYSNHHLSHAASAFLPSGFDNAVIVCIDAVGEFISTSIAIGNKNSIKVIRAINFPNSIGMLYSAFSAYCGFKVNSGEYKLMGLAPFGEPKYKKKILDSVISLHPDGSYKINSKLLPFLINQPIISREFIEFWGREPRDNRTDTKLDQFYCDIAASIQSVLNDFLILISKQAKLLTGMENLCLAGGVALNCVANSILAEQKIFRNIWIQPAAGDSGTSLGAALLYSSEIENKRVESQKKYDRMNGSYLGKQYSDYEIREKLIDYGLAHKTLNTNDLVQKVASALNDKKIVGYFQYRMEFGPRALGARSILANPRDPKGQSRINLAVKFRESFRPFAPAMLAEAADKYFEIKLYDPFMLYTWKLKNEYRLETERKYDLTDVNLIRSEFPSITHVDYSARVQVVRDESPLFRLLKVCNEIYDLPMLVNTSFNVRGEPIVESPGDAIECFLTTDIDCLAIGSFWIDKSRLNNLPQIRRRNFLD